MTQLSSWVLVLMTTLRTQYHEHESKWASTYSNTADVIASTCTAAPIPGESVEFCAAFLADASWHESRFNPEALGDLDKRTGEFTAKGLFQTHWKDWGLDPSAPPAQQAQDAVILMQKSWTLCAERKPDERFAWYASGGKTCDRALGLSRFRIGEARRLMKAHPFIPAIP